MALAPGPPRRVLARPDSPVCPDRVSGTQTHRQPRASARLTSTALWPAADPVGDVVVRAHLEVNLHVAGQRGGVGVFVADSLRHRPCKNQLAVSRGPDLPEGKHAEPIVPSG